LEGILNVGSGYRKVLAAGMVGLGATVAGLLLTGKLFAAFPLAGIGGFVITAPSLTGTGFSLSPSLTQTDEQGGWPAGMITLQSVNIGTSSNTGSSPGFELTKHFDLSATPIGQIIPSADLNITAATLQGTNLAMDTTGLQATTAHFGGFNLAESYAVVNSAQTDTGVEGTVTVNANNTQGAIDPSKQLGLTSSSLTLTGAAINTDALTSSSLDLSSLRLAIVANAVTGSSYGDNAYDTYYDTATPDAGINDGGTLDGNPGASNNTNSPPIGLVPGQ